MAEETSWSQERQTDIPGSAGKCRGKQRYSGPNLEYAPHHQSITSQKNWANPLTPVAKSLNVASSFLHWHDKINMGFIWWSHKPSNHPPHPTVDIFGTYSTYTVQPSYGLSSKKNNCLVKGPQQLCMQIDLVAGRHRSHLESCSWPPLQQLAWHTQLGFPTHWWKWSTSVPMVGTPMPPTLTSRKSGLGLGVKGWFHA